MSTSVQRAVQFANPVSGEVLTLDSPDSDLGRYLADLREFESVLREHKRIVTRELLARMDHTAAWTLHCEGALKLQGTSPAPVEEWDGAELRTALLAFMDDGRLSIEAIDAAVETVVTYKPVKRGIQQLRKLGGEIAETIDQLAQSREPDRRISVTR